MYIKRVELSHFKSFGGTTQVPLLPGFTVISGPNGSGKSNILDALLFALGLSSSKGMRADRLPDLVNQTQASRGRSTVEASVTVTFALDIDELARSDEEELPVNGHESGNGNGSNGNGHHLPALTLNEWNVTRKLRVTQQGTYTSNYYINGEPCTLTDLHEQLQRFHVYPEGYNVVLQGDVTSIISMNPRERREIIDELAGVGSFDRKINQAKEKLDAVKEREEKFRIVEKELIVQRDRLAQDRLKAEKYQRLRQELQAKSLWEGVLVWRLQQQQRNRLVKQIEQDHAAIAQLNTEIAALNTEIQQATVVLDELNTRVKALGEEEQLALQSTLATREAELRQLQRQEQTCVQASQETIAQVARTQRELHEHHQQIDQLSQTRQTALQDLATSQAACNAAEEKLNRSRADADAIAAASDTGMQEQVMLRQQIESLLQTLEPQRTEQARLQERSNQLQQNIQTQTASLAEITQTLSDTQAEAWQIDGEGSIARVQNLAASLAQAEQELQIQQETQTRLLHEQREKQRQLDKLEAQSAAMQEAQGTGATQVLIQAGLPGICGLVAQLGRVDSQYQLALEIAAGGRLGYLVVEDDGIAAAAIELLKRKRAGRATFLPLNKIRAPQFTPISAWKRPQGFIDYAANLIDCDDHYREIFAYIFGNTVVFADMDTARRNLGQYRIVTMGGELLETSGAMTGGSVSQRSGSLRFGTVAPAESTEATQLRDRLHEIDRILSRCEGAIAQATLNVKTRTQTLNEARQQQREIQLRSEQLQQQIRQLVTQEAQLRTQIGQQSQEFTAAQDRLNQLDSTLPALEAELQQQRQILADLEQSQAHSEWQQIQATLRRHEAELSDRQLALRSVESRLHDLDLQQQRLQEKIQTAQQRLQEWRSQQTTQHNQQAALQQQQSELREQIAQVQTAIAALEQTLAAEKQARDRAERQVRDQQTQQQQQQWQRQKFQESLQARREQLAELETQLAAQQAELPDPLPEVPAELGLEQLQQELRSLQKRLQAMEPVNMLALEEYDRTQARLEELSQKLATLEEERTELLLRIENFTTLRQMAFKEAFDAVNENFQTIFAELSDGDGHLQLDDPHDPFASGLNLVAHPKGKPVRRLASMSGGEKSLTALSFIFALQRYRPSPFYAFDEVDMFLDGANVERLAKMIRHQAQQAQFIVVSLRRPMIESADRTIGVTQARGAYTQVLGINLRTQSASV